MDLPLKTGAIRTRLTLNPPESMPSAISAEQTPIPIPPCFAQGNAEAIAQNLTIAEDIAKLWASYWGKNHWFLQYRAKKGMELSPRADG
jgi:hypothetical protein